MAKYLQDLNTATKEELVRTPGVGKEVAAAIIDRNRAPLAAAP